MLRKALHNTFGLVGLSLAALSAAGQSPTPFNTAIRNYVYVGKTGYNANVARITLHVSGNPAQANSGFDTGNVITFAAGTAQDLNAAGINRNDGYLYAMEYLYSGPASIDAKFFRIGANARAQQVGIIPGPSSADAGRTITYSMVNLASGTIDSAGNYWFTAFGYTDLNTPLSATKMNMFLGKLSGIGSLSASTSAILSPTYYPLDISDTLIQRGMTNLMTQQAAMAAYSLPVTNADGGWQDMDINPAGGELYSYVGFPSAQSTVGLNPYPKPPINSYLVRISKTTSPWSLRPVNTTPVTYPNREEDGAYFDGAGNFYVSFTDGSYSSVNMSTGALNSVNQSTLPLYQGNLRGDFASNAPLSNIPLPTALLSFSAGTSDKGNELSWQSGTEINVGHFELMRSEDARTFTTIASLQPEGQGSNYHFTDETAAGRAYYRVKIAGINGNDQYSDILSIAGKSQPANTSVYPSVVNDGQLHVKTTADKPVLKIYNLNGQLVQQAGLDHGAGSDLQVQLRLASGSYLVQLTEGESGATLCTQKVMIP